MAKYQKVTKIIHNNLRIGSKLYQNIKFTSQLCRSLISNLELTINVIVIMAVKNSMKKFSDKIEIKKRYIHNKKFSISFTIDWIGFSKEVTYSSPWSLIPFSTGNKLKKNYSHYENVFSQANLEIFNNKVLFWPKIYKWKNKTNLSTDISLGLSMCLSSKVSEIVVPNRKY